MDNLTGKLFDTYEVRAALGEGGMAAVYKAFDTRMQRFVALKVLPQRLAQDPAFVQRFKNEAALLAQLQHPHILTVFDFGEAEGYTYFVMPLVESGTLDKVLRGQPLPWPDVRRVLLELADALDYAHTRGIVHRDIKPSNVLLDASSHCLLTDFGIAKIVEGTQRLTQTGGIIGTPAYMSPEQCRGDKVDARSDIYSLGVVLYELATGRVPFHADTPIAVVFKHIQEPVPPPEKLNEHIPSALARVLEKALAKDPAERYQTARDLGEAVRVALPEAFSQALTRPEGVPQVSALPVAPARPVTPMPPAPPPATPPPPPITGSKVLAGGISNAPTLAEPPPPVKPPTTSLWGVGRSMGWGLLLLPLVGMCLGALAFAVWLGWGQPPQTPALPTLPETTPVPGTAEAIATRVARSATEAALNPVVASPTWTPMISLTPTPTTVAVVAGLGKDGMVLLPVLAGAFNMGAADFDASAEAIEQPRHLVTLDTFWIDETEVTNAQFAQFVNQMGHQTVAERLGTSYQFDFDTQTWVDFPNANWRHPAGGDSKGGANDPVTHVAWSDAAAYCAWAGRRLPTEAEWEKAARGTDGRLYPWGNTLPDSSMANYDRHTSRVQPVKSYALNRSPYGAYDMAGNVWEWTQDYFASDYYATSPATNPPGPATGTAHVVRGGGWSVMAAFIRTSNRHRYLSDFRSPYLGFRCATTHPPTQAEPQVTNFQACLTPCAGTNAATTFPEKTTRIYAQWDFANVPTGAKYTRTWSQGGQEWVRYECTWSGPANGTSTVSLREPEGLRSGPWGLTIAINDVPVLETTLFVEGNWTLWTPVGVINECGVN